LNVIFGESTAMRLARLLPKLITFEPPPCIWFIRKTQKPRNSTNGRIEMRIPPSDQPPRPVTSTWAPLARATWMGSLPLWISSGA
jgi:hypothetical protein